MSDRGELQQEEIEVQEKQEMVEFRMLSRKSVSGSGGGGEGVCQMAEQEK